MTGIILALLLAVSPVQHHHRWHLNDYATFFGPGLYGNRTACGQRLTRRLVGVAMRHKRCGTRVTVRWHGRTVRTRVVDHGPWGVPGLDIDMTAGLSCWKLTGGHPSHCSSKSIDWRLGW